MSAPAPATTTTGAPAPASDEQVVAVRGLTKVFKDFWGRPKARAVDNISFEVRRGEVFGLLGPNGSGKSTTVKMLLGLLYPTKGHIEVFGHSPRHVATKSRIGYLPEESYLYRYLNSKETLDFFGKLFSLPAGERGARIEQLLEMVGLAQTSTRTIGEFSKGMQRRIGLAQALINDPDLVILDEPTAGLDPIGCREVKDLILALARRGKTVILSSHLLADVEDVCDRVLILYGGRIQAAGTLKQLLDKPGRGPHHRPRAAQAVDPRNRVLEIIALRDAAWPGMKSAVDNPTSESRKLLPGRRAQSARKRRRNLRGHFRQSRGGLPARRCRSRPRAGQNTRAPGPARRRRGSGRVRAPRAGFARHRRIQAGGVKPPGRSSGPRGGRRPAGATGNAGRRFVQGQRETGVVAGPTQRTTGLS